MKISDFTDEELMEFIKAALIAGQGESESWQDLMDHSDPTQELLEKYDSLTEKERSAFDQRMDRVADCASEYDSFCAQSNEALDNGEITFEERDDQLTQYLASKVAILRGDEE